MEEQNKNTAKIENDIPLEAEEISIDEPETENSSGSKNAVSYILPMLLCIFLFSGFVSEQEVKKINGEYLNAESEELSEKTEPKINFTALLAGEEFSKNLKDTVYTDKNLWLELRIDQQVLYVHYRNGKTKTYNVSTGNKFLSKGIESRPGLFAIFLKEEVHKSSQFNNAQMNYFMPYNMGIGFHGLPGSGYYGHLGKQPSSHGCIRMRNEDVRELFKETDVGTFVLAHRGYTNRVVAFAPDGFKNGIEYTKDDYMNLLAYNLSSIMEGKYFTKPPKKFILDGKVIPRSGINVLSNEKAPEKQILPFTVAKIVMQNDRLEENKFISSNITESANYEKEFGITKEDTLSSSSSSVAVEPEMIKKYVYNPVGILPYFPPNR
ncbi:MAG: L,D-transpeptidase family protein [Ignavibacteria bacterium]|nr:L,D-transpeptidase family protein [Ignavibacteria bacterium]